MLFDLDEKEFTEAYSLGRFPFLWAAYQALQKERDEAKAEGKRRLEALQLLAKFPCECAAVAQDALDLEKPYKPSVQGAVELAQAGVDPVKALHQGISPVEQHETFIKTMEGKDG